MGRTDVARKNFGLLHGLAFEMDTQTKISCLAAIIWLQQVQPSGKPMNRSNEEKLADVMLGEAVLKLLHDGGSINCGSLIEKLSEMASLERNSARKSACQRAIEDIRTSFSSSPRTDQTAANDAFTVSQLFAVRGPADDNKKH